MKFPLVRYGVRYGIAVGVLYLVPATGHAQPDSQTAPETAPATAPLMYVPPTPAGLAYEPLEVEPQERADFLSGRIVDETGKPIVGATVDAFHWFPGSETTTDANGSFDLRNKNPDEPYLSPKEKIEVTFSAPGYTPRYLVIQPLGKLKESVVLRSDTFITGTVRRAAGQAVPNAKVRAVGGPYQGDGVTISTRPYITTTDAKGQYKLFVPGDMYQLFVLGGKEASRTPGVRVRHREGLTQDVALKPALTFRARVVDSITGAPVSGLQLRENFNSDFNGTSDKNGQIEINGLFPGEMQWGVDAPGIARWWSEEAKNEWQRKYIPPEENVWQRNFGNLEFDIAPNMAPMTIVAERGVRVRGRVLDPDGRPVEGATVAPALTGTGNSLTGDTRFSVRTNDKGEFDALLPAGNGREWNLMAHDGDYGKWRKWANAAAEPVKTTPGQEINDLTIRLERPRVFTGRVLDADGHPVAHAEVRAVSADKRDNRYYVPAVETDAQGRFTLRFVGPGQHYVQVEPFWSRISEAPEATTKLVTAQNEPVDIGTLTQVKLRTVNELP